MFLKIGIWLVYLGGTTLFLLCLGWVLFGTDPMTGSL